MADVDINEVADGSAEFELSSQTAFQMLKNDIDYSLTKGSKPRFTYVVGNNGAGKSRLLQSIAQYYSSKSDVKPDMVGCISNGVYDRFTLKSSERYTYLGSRSSGNAIFYSSVDRQLLKLIVTGMARKLSVAKELQDALGLTFEFIIESGDISKQKELKTIVDKRKLKSSEINEFMSQEQRKAALEIVGLRISISKLARHECEALLALLALNPQVKINVQKAGTRSFMPFEYLSTGEKNRALNYAKILSVARRRSLIVIDEPEISLHLHWQMTFHHSVMTLLEGRRNIHVVVATHAPIIISEGRKHDSVSKVVVLEDHSSEGPESQIASHSYKFSDIKSHDQLVLSQFDTAAYKSPAIAFTIAELMLSAIDKPVDKDSRVQDLKELLKKTGVTSEDRGHIEAAVRVVEEQTLTHAKD